jgi:lipoprotein
MRHIKKFILLFMLIVTCSIITGCEEEASVINNPTNIDVNQTNQNTNGDNTTNIDNDTDINFIGIDKNHEININSDTIKLISSYQILYEYVYYG